MSNRAVVWVGLSLLFLFACGAEVDAELGGAPPLRGTAPSMATPLGESWSAPWQRPQSVVDETSISPDLLAWTQNGALAVVDGQTGAVRQVLVPLDPTGGREVVYDSARQRAWVVEMPIEAMQGEVASYPVLQGAAGPLLGGRTHAGWVMGDARLLVSTFGPVLLEDAHMSTWRLLGGKTSVAVQAPRPMSAWTTQQSGVTFLHALAYGPSSAELDVVHATLSPNGVTEASVEPLDGDAGSLPPCARGVPVPSRGGALLLDVEGSFLTVRALGDGVVSSPARVPLGSMGLRIEAAVSLWGGTTVVAMLSGITQLVAIELRPNLAVQSMATVFLPGHPVPSVRYLSHHLATQGYGRVVAATSAGVFSVRVRKNAVGVHLALEPAFQAAALRGPVAALWPSPT